MKSTILFLIGVLMSTIQYFFMTRYSSHRDDCGKCEVVAMGIVEPSSCQSADTLVSSAHACGGMLIDTLRN